MKWKKYHTHSQTSPENMSNICDVEPMISIYDFNYYVHIDIDFYFHFFLLPSATRESSIKCRSKCALYKNLCLCVLFNIQIKKVHIRSITPYNGFDSIRFSFLFCWSKTNKEVIWSSPNGCQCPSREAHSFHLLCRLLCNSLPIRMVQTEWKDTAGSSLWSDHGKAALEIVLYASWLRLSGGAPIIIPNHGSRGWSEFSANAQYHLFRRSLSIGS